MSSHQSDTRSTDLITFTSLAHVAPRKRSSDGAIATLVALLLLALALLGATTASAAEPPSKPRCSFVYINGDAVISCPRVAR